MVLAVVLGVALVVTLLLSGLLCVPFAVTRYAQRKAESVAEVYRAESALLSIPTGRMCTWATGRIPGAQSASTRPGMCIS